MNYSILIFGFVCLVLEINGAVNDEYFELRQRCLEEVGSEKADGISSLDSATFLQNPKSKCYLKCFAEGLELYKEDNTLDVERAIGLIDEDIREQAHPLFTKCVNESANIVERCEKTFEAVKCLYETAPNIFQQLGVLEPPKQA